MRTYVLIVEKSPCGGHLASLPEFYREKSSEPCLPHSVLSLGYLALFNNRHQSEPLWIQARKHYSAALAALAAAIDTNESAVRDEVFASALFLGIFTVREKTNKNNKNQILVSRTPDGIGVDDRLLADCFCDRT
jgi:hypothetical protein